MHQRSTDASLPPTIHPHRRGQRVRAVPAALATACALLATACDGAQDDPEPQLPGDGPLYAVESLIFGDQGRFSYVALLPSLEEQPEVLLDDAREFPEYAPADAHGGMIVVGSGEAPTLTGYAISDSGDWIEAQTVSFARYATQALEASVYVGADKAYVPFDRTNHVTWNPATFTIGAEVGAPPGIPLTRGANGELAVTRGYAHALRGDTLFQPYYWADQTFDLYAPVSQVSVIDTAGDRVASVVDVPCPHLHITTQDEDGDIYFSNGQGSIAAAVLDEDQPANCFARIAAGSTALDAGSIVRFRDLTGGREGSNFFYIGDGVGFFNVYHAERDDITPETSFADIDFSSSYHLWTLDLATMEARIMDGIDYAGGQFLAFRIDERSYVAVPTSDYARTAVYEVFSSGRAEKRFDVQGWAFKMFRVR
jgi:hypothetical protein